MQNCGKYKPAPWKQVVLNITDDKVIEDVTYEERNVVCGLVGAYNHPRDDDYHYLLTYAGDFFKKDPERFKQIFGVSSCQKLIESTPLPEERKKQILETINKQMKK